MEPVAQREYGRRQILQLLGASASVAVAGCLGGIVDDGGSPEDIDWRAATLTDTKTGAEFRIEEFDQPALIHTFAANCVTCAHQQEALRTLSDQREDIEIVELSVDPNDLSEDLASYAERSGVEWRVGVAPETVTRGLIEEFGREVSVSAQSPIIIVCPDGVTSTISKVADPQELERVIEHAC